MSVFMHLLLTFSLSFCSGTCLSAIQLKLRRHSYITSRWKKHSADLPLNTGVKILRFRALLAPWISQTPG